MTIDDILASLERRRFYTGINYNTAGVQAVSYTHLTLPTSDLV